MMRCMNPKQIVAGGYDEIWSSYERWGEGDAARLRWVGRALAVVPARRSALDLGCGTGSKATAALSREFATVSGVDISANSLNVASARLPEATFIHADMASIDFPAASYDLVTAFYSIIHVPRAEQPELVRAGN